MHLGNGAITPECAAVTYGLASVGLGGCVLRSITHKGGLSTDKLWLAGGLGCAAFAAQAINVPVAPGISGHLVGGVLLAWALGPALGALTMAIVLAMQALALGDGGIAALGANVINMALLPAAMVALMESAKLGAAHATTLGLVSGLAVVLAAMLIVGETALFRPAAELTTWTGFAARMLGYHLWIGALESAATVGLVTLALAGARHKAFVPRLAIGLAAAVVVAALLLPISSSLPDSYEAAAARSGLEWLLTP